MRWHSSEWPALQNSHDSVDGHQNRMLRLRRELFPNVPDGRWQALDEAILTHDLPEFATGDWSRPDKDGIMGLKELLDLLEQHILDHLGISMTLDVKDEARLRLLDLLDAWLWGVLHEPRARYSDSFLGMRAVIIALAGECGVSREVMWMIGGA